MSEIYEQGNWTGWNAASDGSLEGPDGQKVRKETDLRGYEAKFPWTAFWSEGDVLVNPHDKVRRFQTALAAREAIERAMAGESEFRRIHGKEPERLGR
ncbi:hypothetical protein [Rhizobium leguminosarum]|uniref:hypothetical protein n=1 Tax=Rhizobium leguminosarum TaxID=384 RepID=UPI002E136ADF|nr:hypothetical protein U8Q02_41320 [Rhizobium leguminosarum]